MVWAPPQSTSSVSFWHCDAAKLNNAYSRIARSSGLTSLAPTSRTLSQDTLRCWEKAARESTYVCNQAAELSMVKQGMQTQLRIIQYEQAKGKSAGKAGAATEEVQYLMNFSNSITQCVAKAMEHLSDFTFVSMVNVTLCTLCRRTPYLADVKSGSFMSGSSGHCFRTVC